MLKLCHPERWGRLPRPRSPPLPLSQPRGTPRPPRRAVVQGAMAARGTSPGTAAERGWASSVRAGERASAGAGLGRAVTHPPGPSGETPAAAGLRRRWHSACAEAPCLRAAPRTLPPSRLPSLPLSLPDYCLPAAVSLSLPAGCWSWADGSKPAPLGTSRTSPSRDRSAPNCTQPGGGG